MKDAVFSFDAFFVTETENYEANGVLFRGNLRGDPAAAYEKMQRRLRSEFGEKYAVFLLQDQKEKPVVCPALLIVSFCTRIPSMLALRASRACCCACIFVSLFVRARDAVCLQTAP